MKKIDSIVEEFEKRFPLSFFATENYDNPIRDISELDFLRWQRNQTNSANMRIKELTVFLRSSLHSLIDEIKKGMPEKKPLIKGIAYINDNLQANGYNLYRQEMLNYLDSLK